MGAWHLLRPWLALVLLTAAVPTAGAGAPSLSPLVINWEDYFQLDW